MSTTEGLEQYVKVLLSYDLMPDVTEEYYRFMLGKMVPAVQRKGLTMLEAWHTAVGDYPIRLVVFVAENRTIANRVLESDDWQQLEDKLQEYVVNYSRRMIALRDGFQF